MCTLSGQVYFQERDLRQPFCCALRGACDMVSDNLRRVVGAIVKNDDDFIGCGVDGASIEIKLPKKTIEAAGQRCRFIAGGNCHDQRRASSVG